MNTSHKVDLPLVTIIVPCYNHENYIVECIESLVHQTYPNIELIVLDDGSSDNSAMILKELSQKYNFYFDDQQNIGLSRTLNKAISLSSGDYISVCASDDKYALDKTAKQVTYLQKNPKFASCFTNKIIFDDKGNERIEDSGKRKSGWIFKELLMDTFSIPAPSHMIRREVFNTIGLYDESLKVEDWDMWLRMSKKYQLGFLDQPLIYYRVHDTNTHGNVNLMLSDKYTVLEKWKDDPLYLDARKRTDFHYFNDFANIDKKRALAMLPTVIFYWDKRIVKGIRRLLLKW